MAALALGLLGALVIGGVARATPEDDRCARLEAKAQAAQAMATEEAETPYAILADETAPVTSRRAGDGLATPLGGDLINLDSGTARVEAPVAGGVVTYLAFTLHDKPAGTWTCQRVGVRMAYARLADEPSSPFYVIQVRDQPFGSKAVARQASFFVDRQTGALRTSVLQPPFALMKLQFAPGKDELFKIKAAAEPLKADRPEYDHALQRQVLKRLRSHILASSDTAYQARNKPIMVGDDDVYFLKAFAGLGGVEAVVHGMIVGGEMGVLADQPSNRRNGRTGARSIFAPADAVAAASGLSFGPYQADIDQDRWERPIFLNELQTYVAGRGYRIPTAAVSNFRDCFYRADCLGQVEAASGRGIRRYKVAELDGYQELLPIVTEYLQNPRGRDLVLALHEAYLVGASRCLTTAYRALPTGLTEAQRKLVSALFVDGFNQHNVGIGMGAKGIFGLCSSDPTVEAFIGCVITRRAAAAGTTTSSFQKNRYVYVQHAALALDPAGFDAPSTGFPSASDPQIADLRRKVDAVAADGQACVNAAGKMSGRFDHMVPPPPEPEPIAPEPIAPPPAPAPTPTPTPTG